MGSHKKIESADMSFKPAMTQSRKVAGRVVEEEIDTPSFSDDDIGGLLEGIDSDELEAGRSRIARENPEYAAKTGGDMVHSNALDNIEFESEDTGTDSVLTSSKRFGSITDVETTEILDFKRLTNGAVQLSSPDTGEVQHTMSSVDFDTLIDSDDFTVL